MAHSPQQVRNKTALVKKVLKHHFGAMPKKIIFKPAGKTNFVFEANTKDGDVIVRIAAARGKISDFIKEQWAVDKAAKEGIPVAEILEVGNEIIPLPYMLQRKLQGQEAVDHPDRLKILHQLGVYAKTIHSIETSNYGNVFNWSRNQLSKNTTWKDYLEGEWGIQDRVNILQKNDMLNTADFKKLNTAIKKIEKLKGAPCLNHGDLRLKNVIVDDKGKVLALIDWEHCTSNMAPFWDLSIALHDLSIDGKQHFLEGYGIAPEEYSRMSQAIKAFNILNYADTIRLMAGRGSKAQLEFYRLRLKGYMDLFSL